jgi:hypothetical protein
VLVLRGLFFGHELSWRRFAVDGVKQPSTHQVHSTFASVDPDILAALRQRPGMEHHLGERHVHTVRVGVSQTAVVKNRPARRLVLVEGNAARPRHGIRMRTDDPVAQVEVVHRHLHKISAGFGHIPVPVA